MQCYIHQLTNTKIPGENAWEEGCHNCVLYTMGFYIPVAVPNSRFRRKREEGLVWNAHTFAIPHFPQYSVHQCRHMYRSWYLLSPDHRCSLEIRTCGAQRPLSFLDHRRPSCLLHLSCPSCLPRPSRPPLHLLDINKPNCWVLSPHIWFLKCSILLCSTVLPMTFILYLTSVTQPHRLLI